MDRKESVNQGGGSSADTAIGRSLNDDDRKRTSETVPGEYVTVGESSSSLDTIAGMEEKKKKKGRFGSLKNSFRKEGGLFKTKKNVTIRAESEVPVPEADRDEDNAKGAAREKPEKKKKKDKKKSSLVRKLSLNKFRLSTEQEPRHTPEGGDSSRSQSQSSRESPSQSDSPGKVSRCGQQLEKIEKERSNGRKAEVGDQESEKLDKPVRTVTVVQRRSPSLTIRSIPNAEHSTRKHAAESLNLERHAQTHTEDAGKVQCAISTLPYAISHWQNPSDCTTDTKKHHKLSVKSDSESAVATRTTPSELPRKLSLLEEKRAGFQRRHLYTSDDTSGDTVIPVTVDDEVNEKRPADTVNPKRQARHISVSKFDTFSTFEGTFDEDTGLGHLTGIEEDYTENWDQHTEMFSNPGVVVRHAPTMVDSEKTQSVSEDSATSQNSSPAAGLGEKREHLYKILVIGELGAGKTSIIKRYVHQFFSQHYRATIGVDFALKVLNWDPHTIIRLQLWDIAGQERFGNMTRVYYKEAVGAFIVFDVTRSATLDAVVKWKQDLDSKVQLPDGSPIPCVLLANKCDQQKEGVVNTPNKMDEYCKEKNFSGWFETSAKENINIEEAARFLVNKILQNDQIMKGNGSQDQADGQRFALNQSSTDSKKSCYC